MRDAFEEDSRGESVCVCVCRNEKVGWSWPGGATAQTTLLTSEAEGKELRAIGQYSSFHKHLKVMKHEGRADGRRIR